MFRWGIFGTGSVSAKFVAGLASVRGAKAVMVASRSQARAQEFANALGVDRAVEGYAEAAQAGGVDAIYIATPPSEHAAHALTCIMAGIPVIVEKPFAASAADARAIAEAASARGVFCMEGLWTRFMPATQAMRHQIEANSIGDVRVISGSFGISKLPSAADSSFDPARGGGALAQLGVYPLSLAQSLLGNPTEVHATGRIGESGVEEDVAVSLRYPAGQIASLFCSLRSPAPNDFQVMGTHGRLSFEGPIFRPYGLSLQREVPRASSGAALGFKTQIREHGLVQRIAQMTGQSSRGGITRVRHLYAGNAYQYQAVEAARCIGLGLTQSPIMPLADSIAVINTIDAIRAHLVSRA
jgi:predicted dehydrogenase